MTHSDFLFTRRLQLAVLRADCWGPMGTCNTPQERTVAWKLVARFRYVSKIELSGLADRLDMGSRERRNQG